MPLQGFRVPHTPEKFGVSGPRSSLEGPKSRVPFDHIGFLGLGFHLMGFGSRDRCRGPRFRVLLFRYAIDFHVNKLASENYTSESKNLVLLPFSCDDEDLPTQPAVNETTTTTTINSRNNANTSNKTVNKTNSILITSSITTTATNNRTDNKNTNTNTVSDSNNFLTPTSETTNNKTNSANTNNSENNTSSNVIPSSID